jgi:transposase InsO family protein
MSKCIEAICTPSTSSAVIINELRTLFAKFGLPETIVTDNGTGLTSQEFKAFLQDNGVKHVTSSPYHPASNGLAQSAVPVVKRGLKKVTSGNMSAHIAKVLFTYRVSPHNTTGASPAELLLGRRLTGEIVKTTGPVSYHVRLPDGRTRRCHQDQLRPREGDEEVTEEVPDHNPGDSD